MVRRTLRVFAVAALLSLLAVPGWGQSDAGYDAYKRGDYATAHRVWKSRAEGGDASAQYNLGLLYHHGLGVESKISEAAKWYGRAAENGNADAQKAIGDLYLKGFWGKKNSAKAATWYRKAAEQGHAEAKEALRKLGDKRRTRPRQAARSPARQELAKPKEKAKTKGLAVIGFGRKCPGSPDTPYEVKVRMEFPPASINHDLSIEKLTGGFHGNVRGMMVGRGEVKFATEYSVVPFGNKFCFWVQSIPVTLRYPSIKIYIAKKYDTRSCQYRAILDHEKDHVRVARDNLERYAPRMRSALTSLLIPTGRAPEVVASPEQAKREVDALARKLLGPVVKYMFADLHKAQAAVDSPESYRRLFRRCRNW